MNRFPRLPRAASLLVLLLLPLHGLADDQDVIDYRKHIMQTLQAQTAALGMILSGAIPDDNVVAHLDTIALAASTARKSFEPHVEGGDANPDVWSNWADFSARMDDFAAKTATMARTAHEQGKDAALEQVIDALSCKGCHDAYSTRDPLE